MVLDQRWAAADSGPGQPTETLSPPENSCWSPCTRKLISAYYSFIDPKRMKGWVDLVGWPAADGLPTWVVTRQLQVGRRTGKDRRPKTDVLPLCQRHQPLFGRIHKKRHRGHRKSTKSVYEETLWTQILFIFGTALEVKYSILRTTKDTLWSYSDLSNCFWPLSVEMPIIFPIKWAQYYTQSSV